MKIQLKHLTKKFKDVVAVQDVNCTIENGEMVCLLGPSGCGKSTTLAMIAGLEMPTEGAIYFDGQDMSGFEAEHRDIGMVFQDYALYPHMTVSENIQFPLKMRSVNVKKKERLEKVSQIAEMLQITKLLHRKPGQLSGGQQQRVAIARALVKQPKILLLDEPFSNLDARLRIELREDIRTLQKKLGITTIFVTHDQEEAMSISDRIILMNQGCVQQYGTPQELYRSPNNLFVARFLGNPPINMFHCISEKQHIRILKEPDWRFKEDNIIHVNEISEKGILGIRPEDFSVVSDCGQIHTKIAAIQTLGKEVYLRCQSKDAPFIVCLRWDKDYQIGDLLELNVNRGYLFLADDEKEGMILNEK